MLEHLLLVGVIQGLHSCEISLPLLTLLEVVEDVNKHIFHWREATCTLACTDVDQVEATTSEMNVSMLLAEESNYTLALSSHDGGIVGTKCYAVGPWHLVLLKGSLDQLEYVFTYSTQQQGAKETIKQQLYVAKSLHHKFNKTSCTKLIEQNYEYKISENCYLKNNLPVDATSRIGRHSSSELTPWSLTDRTTRGYCLLLSSLLPSVDKENGPFRILSTSVSR